MFDRFRSNITYPYARARIGLLSEIARLRSIGRKPVVWWEDPHDGRKIMLVALYQKGGLRPDVIRLMRAARAAGLYVLAVNTLKLSDPQAIRDLADCYIERPNFGRDFGSYRTGFLHLYARGWDRTCPRLLLLNDSIYYNEARLPQFLAEMMDSSVEALGSTENFEIEHHLGSFCLAVGAPVLRHWRFRKYWRNYRLSDVRPTVILRGEMGLTKVLKRCVSRPDQFAALYGAARFNDDLLRDDGLLDFAISNTRRSDLAHGKRATPETLVGYLRQRFTIPQYELAGAEVAIDADVTSINQRRWVTNLGEIEESLGETMTRPEQIERSLVRRSLIGLVGEIFMVGSQIHQNGAVLVNMGLPMVKLDGVYRGVYNLEDVNVIAGIMGERDGRELRRLLLERPYGGHMLFGWKRAAFERGLI